MLYPRQELSGIRTSPILVERLEEVEISAVVSPIHHAERQWTHRKQNRQLAVVRATWSVRVALAGCSGRFPQLVHPCGVSLSAARWGADTLVNLPRMSLMTKRLDGVQSCRSLRRPITCGDADAD